MKTKKEKKQRDQLKEAQARANKLREAKFKKQRLDAEERKAKAYDQRRKEKVDLKSAKLEEAQANAEKRRRQMFDEKKLKKQEADEAAYEARRKEQVKLKSARLEDSQAKAEEIRRQMFGLEEEAAEEEAANDERQEEREPVDQQPVKTKGELAGTRIGAIPAELPNTMAGLVQDLADLWSDETTEAGLDQCRVALADEYGPGALSIFNSYNFQLRLEEIRGTLESISAGIRVFKRGKFSDQEG